MPVIRHAVRALLATPVVTGVAVLSLALGIGANTALFTLVNTLLLKPLPVREPDRLALLEQGEHPGTSWTNPIWEAVRGHESLVDGAFAWSSTRFNLSKGGQTEFIDGVMASGRYFEVLGVPAELGRTFTAADDRRGGGPNGAVAVISHGFWQRRFGGTADVLGRQLTLDTVPFTIVGVTPAWFTGVDVGQSFDVAVPLATEALIRGVESALDRRSTWWLSIMVRLKPADRVGDAAARIRHVQPQIREATMPPDWPAKFMAEYLREPFALTNASTGASHLRGRYQRPLLTLMVVVALVLLIACANIANLLLARATVRRHELAVRLALGASRLRLAGMLLAESLLLSGLGALVGLLFAQWGSRLLVRMISTPQRAVALDLALDWRVLIFTAAVSMVTAVLFGITPAVGATRVDPGRGLSDKGRGVIGGSRVGLSGSLIVVQVALSLVLVVAAGLFVRTFTSLAARDLGFRSEPLLIASVDSQPARVDPANRLAVFQQVREAAASVPGVSNAAVSVVTPVSGSTWQYGVVVPGMPERSERDRGVLVNLITPGWFSTYGMRLVAGRDIGATDVTGAPGVAVVNQEFVRTFLAGQAALGRVIKEGYPRPGKPEESWEVVGVVNDAVYRSLREPVPATMYLAYAQNEKPGPVIRLTVASAAGKPDALVRDVAAAVARVNPNLALTFRPLDSFISASLIQERLIATLSGFFGALGLLLAALGLYGLASYSVSRRRAEIGVRMALGAAPAAVVKEIVARLAVLVSAGVVIGCAGSWWASRFVAKLLFGTTGQDVPTLAGSIALLLTVAVVAAVIPAARAARINPVEVLRE
jgi:putative ABC transport system permease protein